MIECERTFVNRQRIPVVWAVTRGRDAGVDDICAWIDDEKAAVDRALQTHGALVLRGFERLDSAAAFERVVGRLAPELMDYVGGTSPRRVVRGKIMTATELPPTFSIPLHQEMAYTDHPPERIAFFCEVPPASGGQTTIGDARQITERINPSVRDRWKARGVQLRRTLPSAASVARKPGVAKPWSEVFDTTEPAAVETIALARGWKLHWLDDDSVQLWQEIRPAVKVHPQTGDEVWYNQAHIFAPAASLEWARQDRRQDDLHQLERAAREHPELLDRMFHGDGTPIDDGEVLHVYYAHDTSAVPHHWQRGDLLLLDNTLACHGRTAFHGERMILTALIRDGASRLN